MGTERSSRGVLVVVPTFNEADNIVDLIDAVLGAVPDGSVLVVDDASPDGTARQVEAAAARHQSGRVALLRRPGKAGLGTAYVEGFRWGIDRGHEVLVQMDADFQHDPADVPRLLAALEDGADMAVGSRYVPGGSLPEAWPWFRRLLSRLANRYARVVLRLAVRDATAGFRAHRAPLLERLDLATVRADGYGFQIGLSHRASRLGATIVEVPIAFGERARGQSKMSPRIVVEAFLLVARWRLGRP